VAKNRPSRWKKDKQGNQLPASQNALSVDYKSKVILFQYKGHAPTENIIYLSEILN
jgi:hypothetical protein